MPSDLFLNKNTSGNIGGIPIVSPSKGLAIDESNEDRRMDVGEIKPNPGMDDLPGRAGGFAFVNNLPRRAGVLLSQWV